MRAQEKCKLKDLICFKRYRKLLLSVVPSLCYHWLSQIELFFFFACLLFKLCYPSLNSFTGWVSSWNFSYSIPFTTIPLLMLLTLHLTKIPWAGQHFHPLLGCCICRSLLGIKVILKDWPCEKLLKSVSLWPLESSVFFPRWLQLGYATAFFHVCSKDLRTCGIGGICWDRKVSSSFWVLHSGCPELLRHPEHYHMGTSQEGSETQTKMWPLCIKSLPLHSCVVCMERVLMLEYFCSVGVCACKHSQSLRDCLVLGLV